MPPVSFLARVMAPASNRPPSSAALARELSMGMMRAPAGLTSGRISLRPPLLLLPALPLDAPSSSGGCALALGSISLHACAQVSMLTHSSLDAVILPYASSMPHMCTEHM
jgi:hypothetical protein